MNAPLQQAIPAKLLRLPDTVAEKLVLCGAMILLEQGADEYLVVVTVPHYARIHVKHDADAEMWAQAMKYLIEHANRPIGPEAYQEATAYARQAFIP